MQSYPSPNAVPADAQPFYASSSSQQQSGLRDPDDLQLTAQLSRGLAPMMNAGPSGSLGEGQEQRGQGQGDGNHPYEHTQDPHPHSSHIPPSHGAMDQMGNQYGQSESSMAPRKRSKVSRACDECRRKKIRCDATGEPGDEQCSSCKRVQARCQFSRVPMKRGPSKGYIKELADRLNHLEGAMQASDIPVAQYLPHHESPMQRRPSDEYSPPPHGENTRKRTYSTVSNEFGTPYMPQRAQAPWTAPEPPRHLPPPTTFSPPQGSGVFRDPNFSPNGIQPQPHWRNPPDLAHRQALSFDNIPEEAVIERPAELDDAVFEGYFNAIHSTFPLLWKSKAKILSKISSCPPTLRDAFNYSLYAAVASLPTTNLSSSHQPSTLKAAQLITSFQFESVSSTSLSSSLIHLQTLMLLAIIAGQARTPGGLSQSVWLGSAVGLAYTLKLHQHRPTEHPSSEEDQESDERLARRVWWALVIMDRWHASSTSSPVLIPDSSVVVFSDDQALLGDTVYHTARLSIVLGHYSTVILESLAAPSDISSKPFYGILLKGELDRCYESFPTSFSSPSNSTLLHLCYWHLRILVNLKVQDYEPYDLLDPTIHTVTQLTRNPGFLSPLTSHFTMLAALALLELTEHDSTRDEAEKGLHAMVESSIAPSTWDAAIREIVARRKKWDSNVVAPVNKLSTAESEQAAVAAQGLQHLADLATSRDIPTGDERKEEEKTSSGPAVARFTRHQPLRELIRDGYLSTFSEAAR